MTATTPSQAQASLDRFCEGIADARLRPPGRLIDPPEDLVRPQWPTVAELAATEPLLALPSSLYPATLELTLPVGDNASVAFRGNRYSVPPGLNGVGLTVRHRLGTGILEVFSPAGTLLVAHRLLPPGRGAMVRTPEHKAALESVVLSSFTTAKPCDRKGNYPPGPGARAEAARLLAGLGPEVVVDLEVYARLVGDPAGGESSGVGA
jgi:hypothetical protein